VPPFLPPVCRTSNGQTRIAETKAVIDREPKIEVESSEPERSYTPRVIYSEELNRKPRKITLSPVVLGLGVLPVLAALMVWIFNVDNEIIVDEKPTRVHIGSGGSVKTRITAPEAGNHGRMNVTVKSSRKSVAKHNEPIIIVSGNVLNRTDDDRIKVVVAGRILDKDGNVRFSTTAPCGILHRAKRLKRMPRESIERLYVKSGEPFTYSVKSGGRTKYQLVFNEVPEGFDEEYTVEVKVTSSCDKNQSVCYSSV